MENKEPKKKDVKIKAKCPTCKARLFADANSVPHCRNGHEIVAPLQHLTPKGTQSTKPKGNR